MTHLTQERQGNQVSESHAGEFLIRRQLQLAKAVLPLVTNEAADAPYLEVEDTLSRLNVQAEEIIQDGSKPPRKLRRTLARYANRLLEITEEKPELLAPRAISLLAHTSDATGKRDLLENTLEQARRAEMSFDTDANLKAIEVALEEDVPFSTAMKTLNETVFTREKTQIVDDNFDFLYDRAASGSIKLASPPQSSHPVDANNRPLTVEESVWGMKKDPRTGLF